MRILVFGKTGQVARELSRFDGVTCLDRTQADLSDPVACGEIVTKANADIVINAAAYTAVDRAEDEEAPAHTINAEAPTAMAKAAAARNIPFIHISTDYVFDGTGNTPWVEVDRIAPLGAYGRTKAAGEDGVRAAGGLHVIIRTAWVFSAHGNNFVKTMLRLGAQRSELNIVADQIGGPTPAADIAAACFTIAKKISQGEGPTGTYHFAGAPAVSWADFARSIFAKSGLGVNVSDISNSEYPTPAKRPANSQLNCSLIKQDYGITAPDWNVGLDKVLKDLGMVR